MGLNEDSRERTVKGSYQSSVVEFELCTHMHYVYYEGGGNGK